MELNSLIGLGVAEPNVVEVSPENLRSLLGRIETELHHSQVYQIALGNLQKILGDSAPKGELLIKAVGREAIQLALKQLLIHQPQTIVQTASKDNALSQEVDSSSNGKEKSSSLLEVSAVTSKDLADSEKETPNGKQAVLSLEVSASEDQTDSKQNGQNGKVVSSAEKVISSDKTDARKDAQRSSPEVRSYSVNTEVDKAVSKAQTSTLDTSDTSDESSLQKPKKRKNRLTKAEIAAQAIEKRETSLRQVGQELRQAREALSLSLTQLHRQTLVPLSHLRALETGDVERLPEDVYLRGFICRLGNALGLNGTAMAASIPAPDPLQHLVPTWSKAEVDSNFYLNSVHLYLGYAAILAGSLGGIAWLSQQSAPETSIPPEMEKLLQENGPQSHHNQSQTEVASTPGLESGEMGVVLGADIAPPEAMDSDWMPQEMTSIGFSSYQPEG
ncbi:MAG: helix-turn-helix domain-containing protein [Cyanobacteria bacterium J06592_8]